MKTSLMKWAMSLLFVLAAMQAQAQQQVVGSQRLPQAERGVFTLDGRYFVISGAGVEEIKRSPDSSTNCSQEATQLLTICTLVRPVLNGTPCTFTGMTTDGIYLFAICSVNLAVTQPVSAAALFRILPGPSAASEVKIRSFDNPTFYNGMTVLGPNTLLLTDTSSGLLNILLGNRDVSAVTKLTITNEATLDFQLSEWLPASPLLLAPNGITRDGNFVYFVGGQSLFRIRVLPDGSAGIPILIYQAALTQTMDDLVAVGNRIAVAEIALVNGVLGANSITFVNKAGLGEPVRVSTGLLQLSAVAVDRGTLFDPGDIIATSFFQGGVYRFSLR